MVTTRKQPAAKPAVSRAGKSAPVSGKKSTGPIALPPGFVAKPLSKVVAKPAAEKPAKVKKPKLVRDRFTVPKTEYTVLDELKQRAEKLDHPIKKNGLLRAGIKVLAALPDEAFLSALNAVPTIRK